MSEEKTIVFTGLEVDMCRLAIYKAIEEVEDSLSNPFLSMAGRFSESLALKQLQDLEEKFAS